jgi:hypothetical protein
MTLRPPRSEFVRKALLALAPAMLLLAMAGSASASTKQETILQDDRLFGDPGRQLAAIEEADSLGVDTIHTVVVWDTLAPKNTAKKKPAGFNGADLGDYDAEKWDRFDDLVREANKRGIDILMSPSGPVPTWASTCKKPGKPKVCEPNAKEYQAFFTAVVKRYNGRTRDENQGNEILPKVDRFSVWNEPNLKGWLQPTSKNVMLYRDLFYAAQTGLAKGGQRRAQLLLGEVAPLNGSLRFYQQLFCIDAAGKALQSRAATKAGCKPGRRIKQLKATGVAHHPYARGGAPPFKRVGRDDITLREIAKLENVLNQGAKAKAIKRNLKIYLTEFGISTRPPAKKFGVPLSMQAKELNHSEFVSYDNKRISSFAQFQLLDDTNIDNFQTGLKFEDGKEKSGYTAFRMPIYVTPSGNQVRVWGGVRPGAGQPVDIQTGSGSSFTTVKTVTVKGTGYIDEKIARPSGKIRLRWTSPTGEEFASRDASVDKAEPVVKRR